MPSASVPSDHSLDRIIHLAYHLLVQYPSYNKMRQNMVEPNRRPEMSHSLRDAVCIQKALPN